MTKPPLLFIAQRLPYPPNKGEKIRSYHFLKALTEHYSVHLASFIDDMADREHLGAARALVSSMHIAEINPRWRYPLALPGWLMGQPVSYAMFRRASLARWVRAVAAEHKPQHVFVYSSNAADYALTLGYRPKHLVFDYVDVDSAKFGDVAALSGPASRWLYELEEKRVRAAEARLASQADTVLFVSEPEAALFRSRCPAAAAKTYAVENGVDLQRFQPDPSLPMPDAYRDGRPTLVFTGAMDYWPNIDAVTWFAKEVMPAAIARHPSLRFAIVGSNPAAAVSALAGPSVLVTGRVPEVQPFVQHAAAMIAPLRVARGLQNKVLEGLAMGRPLIASPGALTGIAAEHGQHVLRADGVDDWLRAIDQILSDSKFAADLGAAARNFVAQRFGWARQLDRLLAFVSGDSDTCQG
jgi:polysaccharide biosynthesis protein PslH